MFHIPCQRRVRLRLFDAYPMVRVAPPPTPTPQARHTSDGPWLPTFDSSEARHGNGLGACSPSQHDLRIGQAPSKADRVEDHHRVRHFEGDATLPGARPAEQIAPRVSPPAVDAERVGGDDGAG